MNTEPTTTTLPALPDWQRDHLAVLLNSLDGVTITDAERASLTWLAGWERHTIENIVALLTRARQAGPLPGTAYLPSEARRAAQAWQRELDRALGTD